MDVLFRALAPHGGGVAAGVRDLRVSLIDGAGGKQEKRGDG